MKGGSSTNKSAAFSNNVNPEYCSSQETTIVETETSPTDVLNDYFCNIISPPPPLPLSQTPTVSGTSRSNNQAAGCNPPPTAMPRKRSVDNLIQSIQRIAAGETTAAPTFNPPPPPLNKPVASVQSSAKTKLPPPPPPITSISNMPIPLYTPKSPISPTAATNSATNSTGKHRDEQAQPLFRKSQSDNALASPPEEIDYTVNQVEFERTRDEEQNYRRELRNRQSVMLNFEPTTAKDYENIDTMLNSLARIIKINNNAAGNAMIKRQISTSGGLHTTPKQAATVSPPAFISAKPSNRPSPSPSPPKAVVDNRTANTEKSAMKSAVQNKSALLAPHSVETLAQSSPYNSGQSDNGNNAKNSVGSNAIADDFLPLASLLDDPEQLKDERIREALIKLAEANVKKIATRIYVENSHTFRTLVITSLMTSRDVINETVQKSRLDQDAAWALFEVIDEMGIERPLRDFEIVTDVLGTWGRESTNALVLKRYGYPESLTAQAAKEGYPQMCGWLYVETKPGRWQLRFCELTSSGIYYSKDAKGTGETQLCLLANTDVYTMIRSKKNVPTKFCFAVKRQEPPQTFERLEDSVKFLCADHLEKNKDWVLSIRCAKGRKLLVESEKRPSKAATAASASSSFDRASSGSGRSNNVARNGPTGQMLSKSASASQLTPVRQPLMAPPQAPPLPKTLHKTPSSSSIGKTASNNSNISAWCGPQDSDDEMPLGARMERNRSIDYGQQPQQQSPRMIHQALSGQNSGNDSRITRKYGQKLITPEVTADKRLVDVIDRYKGNVIDNGEIINKTRFGDNGHPLVPLTLQEIAAVPAADPSKYQMRRKPSRKEMMRACETCGCSDFAKSHFSETKCANCFHTH